MILMKTKYKILIVTLITFLIVALIILIVWILLISRSFFINPHNPYKSEIKYQTESFRSVQFEIPDFWKEQKSPTYRYYRYQPMTSMVFEDGKDYVSMIIFVEESNWNQTFLEETSTRFLNNSVSLMILSYISSYMLFSNIFDQNGPCKIQCKQEIYGKFKMIKDLLESSEIKEKFDTCVKECIEELIKELRKYDIEDYGTIKTNNVIKQISLKDGSFFIGEAIGLNCYTDRIVFTLFAINSNKISKDKIEEIRSHISNSVKCRGFGTEFRNPSKK